MCDLYLWETVNGQGNSDLSWEPVYVNGRFLFEIDPDLFLIRIKRNKRLYIANLSELLKDGPDGTRSDDSDSSSRIVQISKPS